MLASKMVREHLLRFSTLIARSYPFLSGCGTIAQVSFLSSLLKVKAEPQVVLLKSGELIVIPPDDYVGRAVYYFGDLDPKVSLVCRKILRPGDTAIDIGANIGLVSVGMAGAVGRSGVVHAFEPQPNLASLIVRSAKLNHFDHLTVHNLALGADEGVMQLFVPDSNAGSASLVRRHGDGKTINVPVKESGPFFEQLGLGPIRLIKIDVEGFENSVFLGASAYLRSNPADAILFEANDYTVSFANQPTTKTLAALGYMFFAIKRSFMRLKLLRIDMENIEARYGNDILAVHDGKNAADILSRVGAV